MCIYPRSLRLFRHRAKSFFFFNIIYGYALQSMRIAIWMYSYIYIYICILLLLHGESYATTCSLHWDLRPHPEALTPMNMHHIVIFVDGKLISSEQLSAFRLKLLHYSQVPRFHWCRAHCKGSGQHVHRTSLKISPTHFPMRWDGMSLTTKMSGEMLRAKAFV